MAASFTTYFVKYTKMHLKINKALDILFLKYTIQISSFRFKIANCVITIVRQLCILNNKQYATIL